MPFRNSSTRVFTTSPRTCQSAKKTHRRKQKCTTKPKKRPYALKYAHVADPDGTKPIATTPHQPLAKQANQGKRHTESTPPTPPITVLTCKIRLSGGLSFLKLFLPAYPKLKNIGLEAIYDMLVTPGGEDKTQQ